nr:MAG TPA: hypothetical protein [Caudoviricetes sp.]
MVRFVGCISAKSDSGYTLSTLLKKKCNRANPHEHWGYEGLSTKTTLFLNKYAYIRAYIYDVICMHTH